MRPTSLTSRTTVLALATTLALGTVATPAVAQVAVQQGGSVQVHGTGICTVGYNDVAHRRSFVAAHCGEDGARVEVINPATGRGTGMSGTLRRSRFYDLQLSNDWAAIEWDPQVRVGGNPITGDAWVSPRDIRLGETVCYTGRTSHPHGGATCGRFAGSADNTYFVDTELSQPGDSGGPMWVPGRGFVGVVSSKWSSNPRAGSRNFVVGVVPADSAAVPEMRVVGMWALNMVAPGVVGPLGEALRSLFDVVFRLLAATGLRAPVQVNYQALSDPEGEEGSSGSSRTVGDSELKVWQAVLIGLAVALLTPPLAIHVQYAIL